MKQVYIVTFSLIVVAIIALGYLYFVTKQQNAVVTDEIRQGQETRNLSAEEFAIKFESAVYEKNVPLVWDMLHVDEQARWSSIDEYDRDVNRVNRYVDGSPVVIDRKVTNVVDVTYTHPVSNKLYEGVKKVTVETLMEKDNATGTVSRDIFLAESEGHWGAFSGLVSDSDRKNLRDEDFTTIDYKLLEKEPTKYIDKKVKYIGKITDISENDGLGYLLMDVTEDEYGWWDDSIYVQYSSSTSAVVDDIVTIYGNMAGQVTYESVAGWKITVPAVNAWDVRVKND